MSYVLGRETGDGWTYYVMEEARTGYRALPVWDSFEEAAGYVVENLDLSTIPLLLDPEQVHVVADLNGACLLLENPRNPENIGKVRFVPLAARTTPEAR